MWHAAQELWLKMGPSPFPFSIVPDTESTSWNLKSACAKKSRSAVLAAGFVLSRTAKVPPAPGGPPRGPGSMAVASADVCRPKQHTVARTRRVNHRVACLALKDSIDHICTLLAFCCRAALARAKSMVISGGLQEPGNRLQ